MDTITRAEGADEVGREATGVVPTIGVGETYLILESRIKISRVPLQELKPPYVQQLRRPMRSRVLSHGKLNAQEITHIRLAMRRIR